jgi:hypothetical protein
MPRPREDVSQFAESAALSFSGASSPPPGATRSSSLPVFE